MRRFERVVQPRATWLVNHWTSIPVGIICFALATIITLPVPLGHVLPGTAICIFALGLLERDEVALGIGFVLTAIAIAVVVLAAMGLANGFNGLAQLQTLHPS